MPIKPELRHFYGREWRTVTRPRILKRAGEKCEHCKAPNHTSVWRADTGGLWRLTDTGATWRRPNGNPTTFQPMQYHAVSIVLTVAHLNHISGDDREDNLRALCQWCHLNYDRDHHRATRATRKDAGRPLFQ